jgi:hypothetical protein
MVKSQFESYHTVQPIRFPTYGEMIMSVLPPFTALESSVFFLRSFGIQNEL